MIVLKHLHDFNEAQDELFRIIDSSLEEWEFRISLQEYGNIYPFEEYWLAIIREIEDKYLNIGIARSLKLVDSNNKIYVHVS